MSVVVRTLNSKDRKSAYNLEDNLSVDDSHMLSALIPGRHIIELSVDSVSAEREMATECASSPADPGSANPVISHSMELSPQPLT